MKEFWIDSLGIKSALRNLKFAILLGAMLFALSYSASAQQPKKIPTIGFLSIGSASSVTGRYEAFRQGLRELGYVEGQNILIEWRFAEGKREELPALANDLVRLKVDVIVTAGTTATTPAKGATSTIPIVMAYSADAVGTGLCGQPLASGRECNRSDRDIPRPSRETTGTDKGSGAAHHARSGPVGR